MRTNLNYRVLGTSTAAIFLSNNHFLYAHITSDECHAWFHLYETSRPARSASKATKYKMKSTHGSSTGPIQMKSSRTFIRGNECRERMIILNKKAAILLHSTRWFKLVRTSFNNSPNYPKWFPEFDKNISNIYLVDLHLKKANSFHEETLILRFLLLNSLVITFNQS